MYNKILVALDNSDADKSLLPHVTALARQFQSQLLLVHVADGWVARNFNRLKLAESDEMKAFTVRYPGSGGGEIPGAGIDGGDDAAAGGSADGVDARRREREV